MPDLSVAVAHVVSPSMQIALESPEQSEVRALIEELDAYSNRLTPPGSRHQAALSTLMQPNVLFAVARTADGQAIGCAAVLLLPDYGELKRMYVMPSARGRGVGSALVRFLEATARSRRCIKLMLETGHQHHLAHRAYRANGFRVRGPFGTYRPDPLSVFMEKEIGAVDVSFRVASSSDALCVGVLATQVFLDTYATDGIRPSIAREVLEQASTNAVFTSLAAQGTRFIVSERAGHMLAFAEIALNSSHRLVQHSDNPAQLKRLYVQERFTGAGLGSALLARAEALAASEQATMLWLTAWVDNLRALAFYARRGYDDLGAATYTFQEESYENRVFARTLRRSSTDSPGR